MSKIRIRKRGNTYSYSFDISKNPRRMKEKGGFATEDEAFDAGVKAYADWKSGNIGITSERVKLRDYLAAWLDNVVRPNVKRMTFKNYRNAIHSRIVPHLGETCHLSRRAHHHESDDRNPYPANRSAQSDRTHNYYARAVCRHPKKQQVLYCVQDALPHRSSNQRSAWSHMGEHQPQNGRNSCHTATVGNGSF